MVFLSYFSSLFLSLFCSFFLPFSHSFIHSFSHSFCYCSTHWPQGPLPAPAPPRAPPARHGGPAAPALCVPARQKHGERASGGAASRRKDEEEENRRRRRRRETEKKKKKPTSPVWHLVSGEPVGCVMACGAGTQAGRAARPGLRVGRWRQQEQDVRVERRRGTRGTREDADTDTTFSSCFSCLFFASCIF